MKKIILLALTFSFSIAFFSCSDQNETADGYLSDEQIVNLENRLHNGESITLHSKYCVEVAKGEIIRIKLRSK